MWSPLVAAGSPAELRALRLLTELGVEGLVAQYEVVDDAGRFVARLDLAAPDRLLGFEYDGVRFHGRGSGLATRLATPGSARSGGRWSPSTSSTSCPASPGCAGWFRCACQPRSEHGSRAHLTSAAPEQVVDHAAGAGDDLEVEAVGELVGRLPEALAAARLDRRDGHVQGVDQVGLEELPEDGGPASEADVLAVAASLATRSASSGVASMKWNVVSDSVNEGRRWWVRTNTGVRNGGSSPHQPCHSWSSHGPRCGLNLLAPMISAPMFLA